MSDQHPYALMATTPITHTRVRRMDTTGRSGSRAASSLARARGSTAITGRAMVTGDAAAMATMDVADTATMVADITGRERTRTGAAELVTATATRAVQGAAFMVVAGAGKRPHYLVKRLAA
jgi:hypothetical protein